MSLIHFSLFFSFFPNPIFQSPSLILFIPVSLLILGLIIWSPRDVQYLSITWSLTVPLTQVSQNRLCPLFISFMLPTIPPSSTFFFFFFYFPLKIRILLICKAQNYLLCGNETTPAWNELWNHKMDQHSEIFSTFLRMFMFCYLFTFKKNYLQNLLYYLWLP